MCHVMLLQGYGLSTTMTLSANSIIYPKHLLVSIVQLTKCLGLEHQWCIKFCAGLNILFVDIILSNHSILLLSKKKERTRSSTLYQYLSNKNNEHDQYHNDEDHSPWRKREREQKILRTLLSEKLWDQVLRRSKYIPPSMRYQWLTQIVTVSAKIPF